MVSFYKELFDYNYTCNQKLIDLLLENSNAITEKSVALMSHILNAHRAWNNRINPQQEMFTSSQVHLPDALKEIDTANNELTHTILNNDLLTRVVDYKTFQGVSQRNSIKDILFHVINHSTYHRAQIASDMKLRGITPLVTDYIFFKR